MKDTKRVFGCYAAWDFNREVDDLNRMSEQGWQLKKGGLFSNLFKLNKDVRYRYQLDFNTHIDEMGRYIETFHEQGWEYVNSTFNGWHYFRKIYDPSLPAEEYEIYCDNQSLTEMQGKWKRVATGMSVVLGLFFILMVIFDIRAFRIPTTILCGVLLLELIMFIRGSIVMRDPQRANISSRSGKKITPLIVILFAGIILTMFGITLRPDGMTSRAESYGAVGSGDAVDFYGIEIKYPDFYHFEINGKLGSDAIFTLKNKDSGKVIFTERVTPDASGKVHLKKHMNFLTPGDYSIFFSDFAGGPLDLDFNID